MTKDYPANWRGRQAESLTYDGQVKSAPWVRTARRSFAAGGRGRRTTSLGEVILHAAAMA